MLKYEIGVERGENGACTVVLSGDFFIDNASELKTRLLDAMSGCEDVRLDITAVTAIDLSFLQIMQAVAKSRARNGREIGFVGVMPEAVRNFLIKSGFPNFTVECVDKAA